MLVLISPKRKPSLPSWRAKRGAASDCCRRDQSNHSRQCVGSMGRCLPVAVCFHPCRVRWHGKQSACTSSFSMMLRCRSRSNGAFAIGCQSCILPLLRRDRRSLQCLGCYSFVFCQKEKTDVAFLTRGAAAFRCPPAFDAASPPRRADRVAVPDMLARRAQRWFVRARIGNVGCT
jgi:hypothetical protein